MNNIGLWEIIPNKKHDLLKVVNHHHGFDNLDMASQHIPGGAYTTFRTFEHDKALHLEAHLKRLEETSRLMGTPVVLNEDIVRSAIVEAVETFREEEARVRLTIDLKEKVGRVFISIERLHVPRELDYIQGVRTVTWKYSRKNPKAKHTDFIPKANNIRKQVSASVNEVLMEDEEGCIVEGLSSNFFAVIGGVLWTAEEGVLHGLTRALVLEEAAAEGVKVVYQAIQESEIPSIDEACITSASRAILPVVQIDGVQIGDGMPGITARRLLARYIQRIEHDIESIGAQNVIKQSQ